MIRKSMSLCFAASLSLLAFGVSRLTSYFTLVDGRANAILTSDLLTSDLARGREGECGERQAGESMDAGSGLGWRVYVRV